AGSVGDGAPNVGRLPAMLAASLDAVPLHALLRLARCATTVRAVCVIATVARFNTHLLAGTILARRTLSAFTALGARGTRLVADMERFALVQHHCQRSSHLHRSSSTLLLITCHK